MNECPELAACGVIDNGLSSTQISRSVFYRADESGQPAIAASTGKPARNAQQSGTESPGPPAAEGGFERPLHGHFFGVTLTDCNRPDSGRTPCVALAR
jgi:hypothetical protein